MTFIKYPLAVLFFLCFTNAFSSSFDKIVVFGDSLSDSGNLYQVMFKQFPASPPYFEGRFSNGKVWVEWLPALLAENGKKITLENYAFGGAMALDDDLIYLPGANLTLSSQVDFYLNQQLTHEMSPHTLYVFLIGGNDYLLNPEVALENPELITDRITSKISDEAERLANVGAKTILVGNIPDLGKTPFSREISLDQSISDISVLHNQKLKQKVERLKETGNMTKWIYFNIHEFFKDAYDHPEKYGFEYTMRPCIDTQDDFYTETYAVERYTHSKLINMTEPNCDKYMFFDLVHPTNRGHHFAAMLAVAQIREESI